jgi:hypothetical protein
MTAIVDGSGENSNVDRVERVDREGGGVGALLAPISDSMLYEGSEETNGNGFVDEFVGRQLYFAPFERASVERRSPSTVQILKSQSSIVALYSKYTRALTFENLYRRLKRIKSCT